MEGSLSALSPPPGPAPPVLSFLPGAGLPWRVEWGQTSGFGGLPGKRRQGRVWPELVVGGGSQAASGSRTAGSLPPRGGSPPPRIQVLSELTNQPC